MTETELKETGRLPRHVAIVMDGNGRWAKERGLPRTAGHKQGVETVREIVKLSRVLGIPYLTLYAFSTENWNRPAGEVEALMQLFSLALAREVPELDENGVHIRFIGDLSAVPESVRKAAEAADEKTAHNTALTLQIAVNYGGRAELARAARILSERVAAGEIASSDIDEAALSSCLYTAGEPDVDLFIRTAGDLRISNFLLYQCAYAEMVFPKVYWPDFDRDEYRKALEEFLLRDRRFGGLSKEEKHA